RLAVFGLRVSVFSLLSSFLETVIKFLASLSKFSKDCGVSSQFGGGLILVFFTYTFFRFPRFWRGSFRPRQSLVVGLRPFADQFFVSKASASKSRSRFHEPISISPLASVESKSLFVQISEQVKRFYRNVSTLNASLQQRPKVLNSLSVNLTV